MQAIEKYRGVIVPMVTPLDEQGAIDEAAARRLVEHLVRHRCAPFVAGTTGECSSLTDAQKDELVWIAADQAAGRQLVYAGVADNCFSASLEKCRQYRDAGAAVVVSHLPCYYPIDEDQMRRYFVSLADASPLPVVLYNIPVTTNLSIPLSLIDDLSHHSNIVGVKDSERGEQRLADGLTLWRDREDFTHHLGWAAKSAFGLLNGLDGIVPSSANLVPNLYRGIYDAAKRGDDAEANRLQIATDEISEYYQEGYPLSRSIPIFKAMLSAFDLCRPYAASPMLTLDGDDLDDVRRDTLSKFREFVEFIGD